MIIRYLALIVLLALAVAVPAEAGDPNRKPHAPVAPDDKLRQLHLAADLAAWGRRNRDPLALIVAARMIAGTPLREVAGVKVEGDPNPEVLTALDIYMPDVLLGDAGRLAANDPLLTELIVDTREAVPRGVVARPVRSRNLVPAFSQDVFEYVFEALEPATIYVQGLGATNLDLAIEDESGNPICDANRYSDREICQWTPARQGPFRVIVKNLGPIPNAYYLMSN